ncbi:Non-canonical purine NTP pyrophosphatase [Andreesenia angusta]|uniref:dITP/XTP pyrophosphatase n=1 Tax=Andreesenia angusta TaxID=39480 RepID=A0A1S1V5J2_9FIRM|nr:RdgB/HAM1 family non-canonical purine NTP pyrophosphatase [Andreesenia angusta]OHW61848.1 Non-canonical purine NTP pyrophosphatase [Andreesenia angusta]
MKRLILSTGNVNKLREIKEILAGMDFEVVSKDEMGYSDIEVEETESDLSGNAIKKAKAIWEQTGEIVMADDTGLFVDALGGEPGVYSARYAGENSDDSQNRAKLLGKLEGKSDRRAKFITSIALVLCDGSVEVIEGECGGKIAEAERGSRGFGYDSVFIPEGYDATFAELSSDVKNSISHRARAIEKLKERLEEI